MGGLSFVLNSLPNLKELLALPVDLTPKSEEKSEDLTSSRGVKRRGEMDYFTSLVMTGVDKLKDLTSKKEDPFKDKTLTIDEEKPETKPEKSLGALNNLIHTIIPNPITGLLGPLAQFFSPDQAGSEGEKQQTNSKGSESSESNSETFLDKAFSGLGSFLSGQWIGDFVKRISGAVQDFVKPFQQYFDNNFQRIKEEAQTKINSMPPKERERYLAQERKIAEVRAEESRRAAAEAERSRQAAELAQRQAEESRRAAEIAQRQQQEAAHPKISEHTSTKKSESKISDYLRSLLAEYGIPTDELGTNTQALSVLARLRIPVDRIRQELVNQGFDFTDLENKLFANGLLSNNFHRAIEIGLQGNSTSSAQYFVNNLINHSQGRSLTVVG